LSVFIDVKPGNFGIGLGQDDRRVFMFDFGLARKYVDAVGYLK
jgi:hypothetical protein